MASDNKKSARGPAVAGDVESFSDIEALESQIALEHPKNRLQEAGVSADPVALVGEGTAIKLNLNPGFIKGEGTVSRPFRGVVLLHLNFVPVDSSSLHQISKFALPGHDEILVRLFHGGTINYRFGQRIVSSNDGPGLVSYCPDEGDFDYTMDEGKAIRVTAIGITEDGEKEIWHRMGIPPTPLFQKLRDTAEPEKCAYPLPDTDQFRRLVDSFEHIPDSGFAHSIVSRLRVAELFCLLSDEIPMEGNSISSDVPFSEVKKLSHARAILEESASNPPSIVKLGAMVGLNRRKLTEGFRKVFGETVAGYAREQQMRLGYRLLTDTSHSINDVAVMCGYEYAHNFTAAFRRRFGSSPTDVRKLK